MSFQVELEREEDGRWIAEARAFPGVINSGATPEQAVARVRALAFLVLADQIDHAEAIQ